MDMLDPSLARPGYFDVAYYEAVVRRVVAWREAGIIPPEAAPAEPDRAAIAALLAAEARLIDQRRHADMLDLYTADGAYWIPADVAAEHPAAYISWEFNDRRRLEERVERLATGLAYSQIPATRTVHLYTNLELRQVSGDEVEAVCTFLIQTLLNGRGGQRAGWNLFVLRRTDHGWKIVLKRVNLYDADLRQDNNSFFL